MFINEQKMYDWRFRLLHLQWNETATVVAQRIMDATTTGFVALGKSSYVRAMLSSLYDYVPALIVAIGRATMPNHLFYMITSLSQFCHF